MLFDHFNLDERSRDLIESACGDARAVYLTPLDKGLSGSSVWLAYWERPSGAKSKRHVFKIGPERKLCKEMDAIRDIASVIDPGFPNTELLKEKNGDLALLRQEFLGDASGAVNSLRIAMRESTAPVTAYETLRELYQQRMVHWHPLKVEELDYYVRRKTSFGDALESWWKRAAVADQISAVGSTAITQSFTARFACSPSTIEESLGVLAATRATLPIGPSHGDLHSQNVLLDASGGIQLIDYGWTDEYWRAVDFLMMECSLKFLVSPANAQLDDLLVMEQVLEPALTGHEIDTAPLEKCMLPQALEVVAQAVSAVRRCALDTAAVSGPSEYRPGLALMTAGHSTMPGLNQLFLLHSLAFHTVRASTELGHPV
jgi:hypothetical protein